MMSIECSFNLHRTCRRKWRGTRLSVGQDDGGEEHIGIGWSRTRFNLSVCSEVKKTFFVGFGAEAWVTCIVHLAGVEGLCFVVLSLSLWVFSSRKGTKTIERRSLLDVRLDIYRVLLDCTKRITMMTTTSTTAVSNNRVEGKKEIV